MKKLFALLVLVFSMATLYSCSDVDVEPLRDEEPTSAPCCGNDDDPDLPPGGNGGN